MTFKLLDDVHAIILPAFAGLTLSEQCKKYLDHGGQSILLGESREEYVARSMSDTRRKAESPEAFHQIISEAKSRSGNLMAAVDQEVGGIERLHDLAPRFPSIDRLAAMDTQEFEGIAYQVGCAAAELGINCFLAPILDVVTGQNPWLKGRTFSSDPEMVGRISAAYVRGVQKAGIAATAKHFPGFHNIALDPATEMDAIVNDAKEAYGPGFIPFRQVIKDNVEIVMIGPAIVQAFDSKKAALRSKNVVNILKNDLAYGGLVMADGLNAKATMRGDSLEHVAIDAVNAGCDLLLLADINTQISDVTNALVSAVSNGQIAREVLACSAAKVRSLAQKYKTSSVNAN